MKKLYQLSFITVVLFAAMSFTADNDNPLVGKWEYSGTQAGGRMGLSAPSMGQATSPDTMDKLLDYSRPGQAHEVLGKLAGTWSFQDAKLTFVKGTLVRKAIYNGRFYRVEMTG